MASKESNFFQDIVPDPGSANSSLLDGKKEIPGFLKRKLKPEVTAEPFYRVKPRQPSKNLLIISASVIGVILLVIGGGLFFKKATAEITPKKIETQIATNFVADRGAPLADKLTFQTRIFNVKAQKALAVAGSRVVERKSGGTIVVYNNYSRENFRLRKDTRFETSDGKVFRTPISIVVPGVKTSGGKSVPGSVEITVTADKAGAEYNIGLSDFTLPGLEAEPALFKAIYARSKTPMAGGFAGNVKVVDPLVLEQAQAELEKNLKTELTQLAGSEVTGENMFFEGGSFFTFNQEDEYQPSDESSQYLLKMDGNLSVFVFNRRQLSGFAAAAGGVPVSAGRALLASDQKLEFKPITKVSDPSEVETINFRLEGSAQFIFEVEVDSLKELLAGRNKNKVDEIFVQFPGIAAARVSLFPPWARKLPEAVEKIVVSIKTD